MAKTDVWMPLFIGDYLGDTTHLTTQQHGAYLLMQMTAWKMEGQLPNDDEQLAAICKMSQEDWQKSKRLLLAFFVVTDSFLVHEHVRAEFQRSQRLREIKTEAGKLGGRPKKQNESEQKPNGLAEQKQNETPSPSPSQKKKQNKYSSGDLAAAKFIWERILILNPKAKEPSLDNWADSVRLMREIDSRTHDEICQIFAWANQHKFWKTNILAPDSLRDKFDRLTVQKAEETSNAANRQTSYQSAADRRSAIADETYNYAKAIDF